MIKYVTVRYVINDMIKYGVIFCSTIYDNNDRSVVGGVGGEGGVVGNDNSVHQLLKP
jgi:hypothetical protein